MRRALFFIVVLCSIAACHKQENPSGVEPHVPYQPSYEVGDYFKNDTLEGVVFYTYGAYNGLMVSLEETQLPWCDEAHVVSETGATNPYDGWNNTNLVTANYDLYYFPAIDWSYQRNTWHLVHYPHNLIDHRQWYVPSTMELRYLLMNQEVVNATLASMGYPTLDGKTYWSSTELGTRSAAALQMQDSSIVVKEAVKDQTFYVRAIRYF